MVIDCDQFHAQAILKETDVPQLTDPMNALKSLEPAIKRGAVTLQPCELHKDLRVLVDYPDGVTLRITYAKVNKAGKVEGIALLGPAEPIDGVHAFGLGYAVAEEYRGSGLAAELATKAIEEFRHGMARNGLQRFYVEAIVGVNNHASNAVARRVLSADPKPGMDSISGEPILAYVKLVG
jgi:hypothetical protein